MELNQEFIDSLQINEVDIMRKIAGGLNVNMSQVSAVVGLLNEGSTVPFIARYRKEATGSLDEVQVRDIDHGFSSGKNLEERRIEIIKGIWDQKKLTEPLYENISKAATLAELEDIYLPYKRKKKTRGMIAEEKGLGPLAEAMKELEEQPLREKAKEFVTLTTFSGQAGADHTDVTDGEKIGLSSDDRPTTADLSQDERPVVASVDEALQGAMDIIAEQVSQDPENRASVKAFYIADGRLIVKGVVKDGADEEAAKKTSTYQMYWDYQEPLKTVKPHRILAVNRGEREGVLDVTLDVDENAAAELLQGKYVLHND